jgi:hypothetical protein
MKREAVDAIRTDKVTMGDSSVTSRSNFMTFLTTTFPIQTVAPMVQTIVSAVRPLLGIGVLMALGLFAALLTVFRPLLLGIMHATLMVFKPRLSLEERRSRRMINGVLMLNRMANEYDVSQPNLAGELRNLASRG